MPEQLMTPEAFAQSIKAKYPDYAEVPDAELAAKMLEKYPEYRDRVQTVAPKDAEAPIAKPGSGLGLPAAIAGAVAPTAATLAAEVGTNPAVPRMVGAAARAATTLGALGHGMAKGNLSEIVAAPLAGWQAGKGGYFLGKGAQAVARPLSSAIESAAPLANVAGVVQGALDLAQMAEPNRKDIGFLGIAGGTPDPNHPALLNLLAMKAADGIKALVAEGLSKAEAARVYFNLKSAVARQGAK